MAAAAYEHLKLHITPEKFYVEACDDGADDVLIIDRVSTEVTLAVKKDVPPLLLQDQYLGYWAQSIWWQVIILLSSPKR